MPERNTPDRNDDVGRALRDLDVGVSRLDFWDDVRSGLQEADRVELDDGGAPQWIQHGENEAGVSAPNGRRVWSSKPWLALATAAAVLLIAGMAFVFRPNGDDTTRLDVANPDVANPDVANPDVANPDVANPDVINPDDPPTPQTSTTETTGIEPTEPADLAQAASAVAGDGAGVVDYSQQPRVQELPSQSRLVAGFTGHDLSIITSQLPGVTNTQCEDGSYTGYVLKPISSTGEAFIDAPAGPGGAYSFAGALPGRGIRTGSSDCTGFGEQPSLVELSDQGDISILATLRIPEGMSRQFPVTWSSDNTQVYLHVQEEAGPWSLLTYANEPKGDGPAEPSATERISPGQPHRVLAELAGAVRVEAVDGDITVAGATIAAYPAGVGPQDILVERSLDRTQVAVASLGVLTIANADGHVASFELGGAQITALDWSPTGQLVFGVDDELSLRVYSPDAQAGDGFAIVAGVEPAFWREIELSANGLVVGLSGFRGSEPVARFLRFPGPG